MKKLLMIAGMLLLGTLSGFAQEHKEQTDKKDTKEEKAPLLSPRAFVKTKNMSISYGQPSKKGREIFGGLVPYGQVWRAGANEATEITFKKAAFISGSPIPAGTYTLFINPQEKVWTIILNSELKQWGAYAYEKNKSKDVLSFITMVQTTDKVQEKLLYEWKDKENILSIQWDKTVANIPITFKK